MAAPRSGQRPLARHRARRGRRPLRAAARRARRCSHRLRRRHSGDRHLRSRWRRGAGGAPAHVRVGPVRDVGHRAGPRRGCAWSAGAPRGARGLMRTVYLGTSDFAATVLDRLATSPHRPQLVVTRPDAPRGRGRKLAPPPVAETARLLGIEVFQPEDVNSEQARQRIAAAEPEAIPICAYGALIKEPLLSDHELLNVHPSLLPRWRGAAPVERAIEAGDEETGVSIMRPTAEFDAGPVGVQRAEQIRPDDDYGSLAPRLAALGGELLVEALELQPSF